MRKFKHKKSTGYVGGFEVKHSNEIGQRLLIGGITLFVILGLHWIQYL